MFGEILRVNAVIHLSMLAYRNRDSRLLENNPQVEFAA